MSDLILFNKPYGVLCQFTPLAEKTTLAKYIPEPEFYPAGRLDEDSEGLLLLTNDGKLQARIADPKFKLAKTYWVQVEGEITDDALRQLSQGLQLKDGKTRPAKASRLDKVRLPARVPPIRERKNIPTSWLSLEITEGKNRQVRRMTAHVGFPTLRLFRQRIGPWSVDAIAPGNYIKQQVNLPR